MTPLLKKRQAAEFLAVSLDTIDRYCAQGKLPYIRIPAGKRFDPADLAAFVKPRKFNHQQEGYRA